MQVVDLCIEDRDQDVLYSFPASPGVNIIFYWAWKVDHIQRYLPSLILDSLLEDFYDSPHYPGILRSLTLHRSGRQFDGRVNERI